MCARVSVHVFVYGCVCAERVASYDDGYSGSCNAVSGCGVAKLLEHYFDAVYWHLKQISEFYSKWHTMLL